MVLGIVATLAGTWVGVKVTDWWYGRGDEEVL